MRGHEYLLTLRRRGMTPGIALIDLVPAYTEVSNPRPDTGGGWLRWTTVPHVEVLDVESIRRLDLRFVVGLFVCCGGTDADRVNALHDACVSAGAAEAFSAVYTDTADGSHALSRRATWEACSHG